MATLNKVLKSLTDDDIKNIELEYLKGWHDLQHYGFRVKGFNSERVKRGLCELNKSMSDEYRLDYIRSHYTDEEIHDQIYDYMLNNLMNQSRWSGIELFGCRFGREYARLFKVLLGNKDYRDLSEKCRVSKLVNTQTQLYGGVGLGGIPTKIKAQMTSTQGKRKFLIDAVNSLNEHGCILKSYRNSSVFEVYVYSELIKRFGADDVYVDYGLHPYDKRYPYVCDFYIKSLDLFIELNVHYTHGGHWFDPNNSADVLRVKHLKSANKRRDIKFLDTWTNRDVSKRLSAKSNTLNYLVFWDGSTHHQGNVLVPNLKDFYSWLYDYENDYNAFISVHPENTY